MTTQRKRTRATASTTATSEAETKTSVGAAENEGMPLVAPPAGSEPGTESDMSPHAPIDGSDLRLASVVPDRLTKQAPKLPPGRLPRDIGAFRFRSKFGPVR